MLPVIKILLFKDTPLSPHIAAGSAPADVHVSSSPLTKGGSHLKKKV